MERIIYGAEPPQKQGFWRRQFAADATTAQDRFDLWFGVALPVACFVLDPVIFKGWLLHRGLLEEYRLFAYMVSALQIGMLLCWFTFRRDLETFAAPFAGIFVAGAVFSTVIGIVILPVSVVGLMFVIGIAGFTPFLTAFVYLRTGVRAMKAQLHNSTFAHRYLVAMLTAFLVIAFPLFGSMYLQPLMPQSEHAEHPWDETWDGD
jgi:hypothetical protein